jgi:hypothetical protein
MGHDGTMDIEALREMFYRENLHLHCTAQYLKFIGHTHTTSFLDKLWHALTSPLDRTVDVLRLAHCVLSVIARRVCAEMEAKRDLRSLASVSTGAAKVRRDSFWE